MRDSNYNDTISSYQRKQSYITVYPDPYPLYTYMVPTNLHCLRRLIKQAELIRSSCPKANLPRILPVFSFIGAPHASTLFRCTQEYEIFHWETERHTEM